MSDHTVMTPYHPRWREFCNRLGGPEGCDFQVKVDGSGGHTWKCAGGYNKMYATAILHTMTEIDVDASLAYFSMHGGHCDCEILFNVDMAAV